MVAAHDDPTYATSLFIPRLMMVLSFDPGVWDSAFHLIYSQPAPLKLVHGPLAHTMPHPQTINEPDLRYRQAHTQA
jgi:hypothetical protein